jgi:hypothetical protein
MARPPKGSPKVSAEILNRLPKRVAQPGSLDTMHDVQLEWQRVHRLYWRGQLPRDEFSAALYSLQTGTQITRARDELANAREELQRLADLREQLAAVQQGQQPAIEYIPSNTEGNS